MRCFEEQPGFGKIFHGQPWFFLTCPALVRLVFGKLRQALVERTHKRKMTLAIDLALSERLMFWSG
jgi:hypothetical protein